ncbi:phage tail sheath subtilisin-like domain-containing protein [Caviibacterium pharyngocola]|uniref:Phage tail protein n=1 Tax=Caviibacterium pharyngocola TaxID=28159 RepID=A0A2M8RY07_9PAST|nr:phage tail sheath subtilisin-like domain-containing protein [Caviibacterium pharyngocola]PJG83768.1 phage tail protein [Caviibacterium pharyngocola]
MDSIEFDLIPGSLRHPGVYTEYNTKNAVSTLPTNEQEVLIIAPALGLTHEFSEPTRVYSDVQVAELLGYGSWAHLMSRIAILNNPLIRLSVVGLADNSAGIAAKGSVQLAGTATGQGVIALSIGSTEYKIAVSKGETAEAIANRLSALINGTRDVPVSAEIEQTSDSQSAVKFTAKCKGEIGNEIAIAVRHSVPDLTVTATAFSDGAENADLTAALASVAGSHYHIIISPFTDDKNAKALRDHLNAVSSPVEKKPAIGVLGWRGTMSGGSTFTEKINDGRVTVGWYKGAIDSCALIAAGFGAVIAGEEDPARPLNTLEINGLAETDPTQKPLFSEANQALYHGLTPITVVNHRVQIMRAITTYTKNATNTDDPSLLDLTTIRTLDYTRKAIEQRISLRFPRAKLSSRTPAKVKSEILDVLLRLEEQEILENVAVHKGKLLVQRNGVDVNRLDCAIPADVVNGLHVVANRIDLIL